MKKLKIISILKPLIMFLNVVKESAQLQIVMQKEIIVQFIIHMENLQQVKMFLISK